MGYKINGASAIGDPYQGQPFKIAFLGDSSLGNGGITQKLKGLLGPDSVHIDNFSVASMDKHALIGQMKALYLKGRHYQVLLFSIINSDYPFIYHFSYRWRSDKKCATVVLPPPSTRPFFKLFHSYKQNGRGQKNIGQGNGG